MHDELSAISNQLAPYWTPGVRRSGARSVWSVASVSEMIEILQSHADVTDIGISTAPDGGYRLEIFQGGHPTELSA
jgi:hypothetical protein